MTAQRVTLDGAWTGSRGLNGDDAAASATATDLINILDTVGVPIVVVRRDLIISYFNKAATDVLGLSPSDIGRASRDASVLAGFPRLEEHCSKVIAGGVESQADFRDGDRWFVVRISPHTNGDRQVTGTVLTFTNVTAFRGSINQAIYERECTKAILNTVADPLVVLSADQRIQSANRAFYTMFGVSRDETQGLPLHELGNGAFQLASLRVQLEEMCAGSDAFQPVEVDYVIPGNGQQTLILDAHPLSLPGHSERRVLVTFQDITARKEAEAAKDLRSEEELRRSEAQLAGARRELQLTIDTIPAMVATFRPDGERDFVNKTWRDYFGLTSQATADQGQAYVIRLHPDDAEAVAHAWRASLATGQPFQMEMRILGNDGKHRWHTVRRVPLHNEKGEIVKWYGVMVDIEEQKTAENALRRSEAFLADAQRLSLTGSFSWRIATDEITWSEQLHRIYELDPPLTLGRIRTRIHPEDVSLFEKMVERAQVGANDFEWQYRLLMPDRSIKYLHAVAHATRDRDGQLEYIAAVQDVTQRRLSEEALAKARSELAQVARLTSLGVLTASIAHELNQPLSGIITNASTCLRMLAADPPNVDGARETARRTIRDGNRASEVITRLRALFGKKPPTTEPVDLNEAAREVIALSMSRLQRERVILRIQLADRLPLVTGDRVQLQQVIMNLLQNATDAMNGVEDRPRQLLITTEPDEGDRVRLTVQDAGAGFDHQHQDKLFDAFYSTKSGGMGIGLSVSRSIIENHHGQLWAAPNDGPGATFAFSIPCRSEAPSGTHDLGAVHARALADGGRS